MHKDAICSGREVPVYKDDYVKRVTNKGLNVVRLYSLFQIPKSQARQY